MAAYAANSQQCLKRAFKGKCPQIARNLTSLGKNVGERTVRKMTEQSLDVRRRNVLENMCLLLGSCYLTDRRVFDQVWGYLETYANELKGNSMRFKTLDEAFTEMRFYVISAERTFYQGEREQLPEALKQIGESLSGVNAKLFLKE